LRYAFRGAKAIRSEFVAFSQMRIQERSPSYNEPPLTLAHEPRDSASLDVFPFARFALSRWRVLAISCGLCVSLTAGVSFLLPKKYTATVSMLIEPPAGNDPRGTTAVSPVYLESLKTYEHFANSDSLFEQALRDLNLRALYAGVPIENLKGKILEVTKPRETKILQVSATLADPTKAQELARYIAAKTVAMNRSLEAASLRDSINEGHVVIENALVRQQKALSARNEHLSKEPIAGVEAELTGAVETRSRVDRDLMEVGEQLADTEARLKQGGSSDSAIDDPQRMRYSVAAYRAELEVLRRQRENLAHTIEADSTLIERRKHERDILDRELQTAQSQYEAANTRNNDILASMAFRGERIEILDPGVIPERPSSPKIALNVALALIGSLAMSFLYLLFLFSHSQHRYEAPASSPPGT
jgi:uncharacterized protein involved in exopolysaccharide biosynthesis